MTEDIKEIVDKTGKHIGIGKLYEIMKPREYEIMKPRELDCQGNVDKKTGNFHLWPKDLDIENGIKDEIQCMRNKIIKVFQDCQDCQVSKCQEYKCKVVDESAKELGNGKNIIQKIQKDQKHSDPNIIYVYTGPGSGGLPLCDQHRVSGIFKWIAVKLNGMVYELNFMRFFVDSVDCLHSRVNCILKSLQFDRCTGSYVNQNENSKCDICYPKTACDQTEALQTLLKDRQGKSFCYNPSVSFYDDAKIIVDAFIRFIKICDRGIYLIVKNDILSMDCDNRYYLKLNRTASRLEVYEKSTSFHDVPIIPVRNDFDFSDYAFYVLSKAIPCIFGDAFTDTPKGIFRIEQKSDEEYISSYYPKYDKVKFFGYLVFFEDYFIHSNLYSIDVTKAAFRDTKPISSQDEHTTGCIRVKQEDLDWLVQNISLHITVET